MKISVKFFLWSFFLLLLSGCKTLETTDYEIPPIESPPKVVDRKDRSDQQIESSKKDVYHTVKAGQTLWRIAKTYGLTVDEIRKANQLQGAAVLEKGQRILIPGASQVREILIETKASQRNFIWPLRGKILKPYNPKEYHNGISILAYRGQEVRAARTGRVVFADYLTGYGNTVIIDHEDGLRSIYANNAVLEVKYNDYVFKNQVIARVGQKPNELAFLYFEIRDNLKESNPIKYLPKQ
jgi:murein DD-endopeptidase MepM/ murein hydrolase activator NlpD